MTGLREKNRRVQVFGVLGTLLAMVFVVFYLLPNFWSKNRLATESYLLLIIWSVLGMVVFRVLIGRDLTFDPASGRICTDKNAISKDDKSSGIRGASDEEARRLILNTYKTLLTRGQKGCFVYCENEALKEYFKRMVNTYSANTL